MEARFPSARQCLIDIRESVEKFSAQFTPYASVHAWGDGNPDVESFRNAALRASSLLKEIVQSLSELKESDKAMLPKYMTLSEELHRTLQQTEALAKRVKSCEEIAQAYLVDRPPVLSPASSGAVGGGALGVRAALKRLASRVAELQLFEVVSEDRADVSLFSSTLIIDVGIAKGTVDSVRAACTYSKESESGESAMEESKPSPLLFDMLRLGKVQEFEDLVERLYLRDTQFKAHPGLATALASLERDLCATYKRERSLYDDDICHLLTRGHGMVSEQYSSLKLFYYATPVDMTRSKDTVPSTSRFCYIVVATRGEDFLRHAPQLAKSSQLAALEDYFELCGYEGSIDVERKDEKSSLRDSADLPRSCFLLRLDRPVCLAAPVISSLMCLLSGVHQQMGDALGAGSCYADLVRWNNHGNFGSPARVESSARSQKRARLKRGSPKSVGRAALHIRCHELPGQSSPAALVSVLPFTHLTHIFPILQLLRQQLVFNELYMSCSVGSPLNDICTDTPHQVEALVLPPHHIILEIHQTGRTAALKVVVLLGGQVLVKRRDDTDLPKLTAVLKACHSIPVMVSMCLRNGEG